MSRLIALLSVVGDIVQSADIRWWLHEAANQLAARDPNVAATVDASVDAWTILGGETKMSAIYKEGDFNSFKKAPIEAKQGVLLLAGELFGGIDRELLPKTILYKMEKICAWSLNEAPVHVRYSARLLFELNILRNASKSGKREIKNHELIRHTPLANFLPLCRPIVSQVPLAVVQASIQAKVFRNFTNGVVEQTASSTLAAPPSSPAIDHTLLQFGNFSPSELIYGVARSALDALFGELFHSHNSDAYFEYDDESKMTSLNFPERVKETNVAHLLINKGIYRGIGRALGLSIVLGVPIGFVHLPEKFVKLVLGTAHGESALERAMQDGFNDIISLDILQESRLTKEELAGMWMGSWVSVLKGKELKRLIQFSKQTEISTIAPFMHKVLKSQVFLKELIQRAIGVSYLTVARTDGVYPPITVTFGAESEKGRFNIISGDTTYHMIELA